MLFSATDEQYKNIRSIKYLLQLPIKNDFYLYSTHHVVCSIPVQPVLDILVSVIYVRF